MKKPHNTHVVLTGEREALSKMQPSVESLDAEMHLLPTISFQRCPLTPIAVRMLGELSTYDYLFFSSVRAVCYFTLALDELHIDANKTVLPPVVAVGPMTARAAEADGFRVAIVPSKFTAEHMISGIDELKGKKILFPRSTIAPEDTLTSINKRGAIVTPLSLYETVYRKEPLSGAEREALTKADYVVFQSPSSIRSFTEILDSKLFKAINKNTVVLCIGPRTARIARTFRFTEVITAQTHTTEGVLETLRSHITH